MLQIGADEWRITMRGDLWGPMSLAVSYGTHDEVLGWMTRVARAQGWLAADDEGPREAGPINES
jgi:hypothetical protein